MLVYRFLLFLHSVFIILTTLQPVIRVPDKALSVVLTGFTLTHVEHDVGELLAAVALGYGFEHFQG